MSDGVEQLSVNIQGREFRFKCPAERKQELLNAAKQLDGLAENFRASHRTTSLDHVIVLVAINLICEKLASDERMLKLIEHWKDGFNSFADRLREMNLDLDKAL